MNYMLIPLIIMLIFSVFIAIFIYQDFKNKQQAEIVVSELINKYPIGMKFRYLGKVFTISKNTSFYPMVGRVIDIEADHVANGQIYTRKFDITQIKK